MPNDCLSVFKKQVLIRVCIYQEASQSLVKSDGVRVCLVVGAYMKILEAIFFEDGKKQRDIEMTKETEQKTEAILIDNYCIANL